MQVVEFLFDTDTFNISNSSCLTLPITNASTHFSNPHHLVRRRCSLITYGGVFIRSSSKVKQSRRTMNSTPTSVLSKLPLTAKQRASRTLVASLVGRRSQANVSRLLPVTTTVWVWTMHPFLLFLRCLLLMLMESMTMLSSTYTSNTDHLDYQLESSAWFQRNGTCTTMVSPPHTRIHLFTKKIMNHQVLRRRTLTPMYQ